LTQDPGARIKARPALLALLLGLLIVGVAAGGSASWYGVVPRGIMEFLRPFLSVAVFLPIWALGLVLFLRRRRETKRRAEFR